MSAKRTLIDIMQAPFSLEIDIMQAFLALEHDFSAEEFLV